MIKVKSYFDKEKVIKITKQAQIKSLVMSIILAVVMVVIAVINFVTAITKEDIDWFSLVFSFIIIVVTVLLFLKSTVIARNTHLLTVKAS